MSANKPAASVEHVIDGIRVMRTATFLYDTATGVPTLTIHELILALLTLAVAMTRGGAPKPEDAASAVDRARELYEQLALEATPTSDLPTA